jgi:hypothetical protein
MTVIQPSQINTFNLNIGTADPPQIAVTVTWDLRGKQSADLQQSSDGVTYTTIGNFLGGGSHSRTWGLNENVWYRVVQS